MSEFGIISVLAGPNIVSYRMTLVVTGALILQIGNPFRSKKNQGTPILLVRRGDRLFAMAETCSHFSGRSQKANSKGIPSYAHITSRGLHWRMAESSTGQLFTRSPAWKSGRGMDRSKCEMHLLRAESSTTD